MTFRSLVSLLGLVLVIGCSESESKKLVKAVKSYPLKSMNIDRAIASKAEFLAQQGVKVKPEWETKKIDEDSYEISISLANKGEPERYTWRVTRNLQKSTQKESVWQIEPTSRPAKVLMTLDETKLARWRQNLN